MSDEPTTTVTADETTVPSPEPTYVPDQPQITNVVVGEPKELPETFDLPTTADDDTKLEVKEPELAPAAPTKPKRKKAIVPKSSTPAKKDNRYRKESVFPTPQLRAFKALLALGATEPGLGVTLKAMAKHAKISTNGLRRGIGPTDKKTTAAHEGRYGYKCLISRGMVKFTKDGETGTCYYLTPLGVKKATTEKERGSLVLGKPRRGV